MKQIQNKYSENDRPKKRRESWIPTKERKKEENYDKNCYPEKLEKTNNIHPHWRWRGPKKKKEKKSRIQTQYIIFSKKKPIDSRMNEWESYELSLSHSLILDSVWCDSVVGRYCCCCFLLHFFLPIKRIVIQ